MMRRRQRQKKRAEKEKNEVELRERRSGQAWVERQRYEGLSKEEQDVEDFVPPKKKGW
jgi:hypothetical protein